MRYDYSEQSYCEQTKEAVAAGLKYLFYSIGGALLGLILGIIAVLVLTAGFKLIQPNIRDKDENPVITEQHIDDTLIFKYFYNLKL